MGVHLVKLTMSADRDLIAEVDLGDPVPGGSTQFFEAGELGSTSGNLYLYLDEVEVGSLFFTVHDGQVHVTLGRFDAETQDWIEQNPLLPEVSSEQPN